MTNLAPALGTVLGKLAQSYNPDDDGGGYYRSGANYEGDNYAEAGAASEGDYF